MQKSLRETVTFWASTLSIVLSLAVSIRACSQSDESIKISRESNKISGQSNEIARRALQLSNEAISLSPKVKVEYFQEKQHHAIKITNDGTAPISDVRVWRSLRLLTPDAISVGGVLRGPKTWKPVSKLSPGESVTIPFADEEFENMFDQDLPIRAEPLLAMTIHVAVKRAEDRKEFRTMKILIVGRSEQPTSKQFVVWEEPQTSESPGFRKIFSTVRKLEQQEVSQE